MICVRTIDVTYDNFGNTKTKVDGSGTTTYNYDFENHLTNIDFPNTANDDTHEYDGVGRRMRSKLNGAGDWTNFIFDELTDNLIAEYTLITGTFTIKSLNTWGIGLISTNREGTKRYFHFDGLGSTVALTDFDMNVTDTYSYSAFGVLESSSGSSVNPFRFIGQWGYYDDGARGSQSGLLLLGVRYYSPGFGRFWSWDPATDTNLYHYTYNLPTLLIDPTGQNVLVQACIAAFCAALFNVNPGGLAKPVLELIQEIVKKILEHGGVLPKSPEDCYQDAQRDKPRTYAGELIKAFCSRFGRKKQAGYCLKNYKYSSTECHACCDREFPGDDKWAETVRSTCHTLCLAIMNEEC